MRTIVEISSEEMSKLVNEKGTLNNSCRYIDTNRWAYSTGSLRTGAVKNFELDYCQKLNYYTIYYCLIPHGVEFFVDNHFDYKDVLSRIEKLEKLVSDIMCAVREPLRTT
jgi:hypothetical protein